MYNLSGTNYLVQGQRLTWYCNNCDRKRPVFQQTLLNRQRMRGSVLKHKFSDINRECISPNIIKENMTERKVSKISCSFKEIRHSRLYASGCDIQRVVVSGCGEYFCWFSLSFSFPPCCGVSSSSLFLCQACKKNNQIMKFVSMQMRPDIFHFVSRIFLVITQYLWSRSSILDWPCYSDFQSNGVSQYMYLLIAQPLVAKMGTVIQWAECYVTWFGLSSCLSITSDDV